MKGFEPSPPRCERIARVNNLKCLYRYPNDFSPCRSLGVLFDPLVRDQNVIKILTGETYVSPTEKLP
jgi:hypothetical protein